MAVSTGESGSVCSEKRHKIVKSESLTAKTSDGKYLPIEEEFIPESDTLTPDLKAEPLEHIKETEKPAKSTTSKKKSAKKVITIGYKTGGAKKGTPKSTPKTKRKKQPEPPSHKLTEYFPVRRSGRRPESEIKEEKSKILEDMIRNCDESHLTVVDYEGKGRGVVCKRQLSRGDFVVEYKGDLVDLDTAAERDAAYAEDSKYGCYMYYFVHMNRKYCVDATLESKYLGRLVNHSSKKPNLYTKTVQIKGEKNPRLILCAARQIPAGEELLYDYGERNKDAVASNPWLVST